MSFHFIVLKDVFGSVLLRFNKIGCLWLWNFVCGGVKSLLFRLTELLRKETSCEKRAVCNKENEDRQKPDWRARFSPPTSDRTILIYEQWGAFMDTWWITVALWSEQRVSRLMYSLLVSFFSWASDLLLNNVNVWGWALGIKWSFF